MGPPPDTYVIDASSLLTIGDVFTGKDLEQAWKIVESLAKVGRLRTSEFVFDEVRRNDITVFKRINPLRGLMIEKIDQKLLDEAGRLSLLYPNMAKIHRDRDTADPWIIAIAKLGGGKVICEEGAVKPQRMSGVCTRERVRCGNIVDMLSANGMPRA